MRVGLIWACLRGDSESERFLERVFDVERLSSRRRDVSFSLLRRVSFRLGDEFLARLFERDRDLRRRAFFPLLLSEEELLDDELLDDELERLEDDEESVELKENR
jgi:hypothetical protein